MARLHPASVSIRPPAKTMTVRIEECEMPRPRIVLPMSADEYHVRSGWSIERTRTLSSP